MIVFHNLKTNTYFFQIIETENISVEMSQKTAKNKSKRIAIEFTIQLTEFDSELTNCYVIYSCSEGLFFVQILLIRY
jgi:hypothetical protein